MELVAGEGWDALALDGVTVVVVPVDELSSSLQPPGSVPVIVVGLGAVPAGASFDLPFDVVVDETTAGCICATALASPIAATSLAVLLRGSEHRSVEEGLAAESAVYSVLQSGPEFTRWRATQQSGSGAGDIAGTQPVVLTREGAVLRIELDRPERHNAFNRAMRDCLSEALALARLDQSIERIEWSGRGPSFCSGGDLTEFGTFPDAATAHRTRLTRSTSRLAHNVADRLHVRLHGACIGAGIELPAFACNLVASRDVAISLPEVAFGLIPGAGGTVSLPYRIGRLLTGRLALSGEAISAETALAWGLIDQIE
jgi:hypothetical protein